MTKDEELTLEALKFAHRAGYGSIVREMGIAPFTIKREKALAQPPEQEPVAYCYVQKGTSVDILTFDDAPDDAVDGTIFPLYTTPPKPEQEPVGEVNRYGLDSHGRKWHGIHWYDANVDVPHGTKLYTTPPKHEPRNFCSRCGKRTADLTVIHTCTPPRGLEMT